MIELSHVTKTFGGKKALDELSLRVPLTAEAKFGKSWYEAK